MRIIFGAPGKLDGTNAPARRTSPASMDSLSEAEFTSQLQVNRRTVYRNIDFLSTQGVPL
jgi:hypothetical protein